MKLESFIQVLAKRMLKYYGVSQSSAGSWHFLDSSQGGDQCLHQVGHR